MKKFETKMASWVVALFAVFSLFSCEGPDGPVDWNTVPDADFNITNQVVFQYCGDEIQSSLGQDLSETVFEQSVAICMRYLQRVHDFVLRERYLYKMSV